MFPPFLYSLHIPSLFFQSSPDSFYPCLLNSAFFDVLIGLTASPQTSGGLSLMWYATHLRQIEALENAMKEDKPEDIRIQSRLPGEGESESSDSGEEEEEDHPLKMDLDKGQKLKY